MANSSMTYPGANPVIDNTKVSTPTDSSIDYSQKLVIQKNGVQVALVDALDFFDDETLAIIQESPAKTVAITLPDSPSGLFGDGSYGDGGEVPGDVGTITLDGIQPAIADKFDKGDTHSSITISTLRKGYETIAVGSGYLTLGEYSPTPPNPGYAAVFVADDTALFQESDVHSVISFYVGGVLFGSGTITEIVSSNTINLGAYNGSEGHPSESMQADTSTVVANCLYNALVNAYPTDGFGIEAFIYLTQYSEIYGVENFADYVVIETNETHNLITGDTVYLECNNGGSEVNGARDVIYLGASAFMFYFPESVSRYYDNGTMQLACTYTLVADAYFDNLVITNKAVLFTNCFRLFCRDLTLNGRIHNSGYVSHSGTVYFPTQSVGADGGVGSARVIGTTGNGHPGASGTDQTESLFNLPTNNAHGGQGGAGGHAYVFIATPPPGHLEEADGIYTPTLGGIGGFGGTVSQLSEIKGDQKSLTNGGYLVQEFLGSQWMIGDYTLENPTTVTMQDVTDLITGYRVRITDETGIVGYATLTEVEPFDSTTYRLDGFTLPNLTPEITSSDGVLGVSGTVTAVYEGTFSSSIANVATGTNCTLSINVSGFGVFNFSLKIGGVTPETAVTLVDGVGEGNTTIAALKNFYDVYIGTTPISYTVDFFDLINGTEAFDVSVNVISSDTIEITGTFSASIAGTVGDSASITVTALGVPQEIVGTIDSVTPETSMVISGLTGIQNLFAALNKTSPFPFSYTTSLVIVGGSGVSLYGNYLQRTRNRKIWYNLYGQAAGGGGGGTGGGILGLGVENYGGTGGTGGAGGRNAGYVLVCGENISGVGKIQANGSDGSKGQLQGGDGSGSYQYAGKGGGGGGGAGGNGGAVVVLYKTITEDVSLEVNKGYGGLGGTITPVNGFITASGLVGQNGYDGTTITMVLQ